MWNIPIELHTSYLNDVEKILKSKLLYYVSIAVQFTETTTLLMAESKMFNKRIMQIVSCQQSSIKHVYKYYMSKLCNKHAQNIPVDSTISDNKYRYKQYKFCLTTLLLHVYHDAVSGWLMLGSLFYKTKQYSKALHIIQYSISKCTPEKLYRYMSISAIHYQLLKLQLIRKKGFVCLLKIMFVDNIQFNILNSTLIPDELQMNESNLYPCTAYAYFLNFLCYYHLNNVRKCQDSLECLQLVIDEDYLMTNWNFKAKAYNLLGTALHLLGRKESARQAFLNSVELFPNQLINSAVTSLFKMS
ncbi:unnamed protein product [Mytilus coruscus]|uniref:Uncharacterized protein n=1 Tax=Mytilus coruscus TaxID=42192 RepID=A0A6J8DER2_MYTCO|nr:unnamed protein product [Mytilus coruscus]